MHVLRRLGEPSSSTTMEGARVPTQKSGGGGDGRRHVVRQLGAWSAGELTHVADVDPLQLHGVGDAHAMQLRDPGDLGDDRARRRRSEAVARPAGHGRAPSICASGDVADAGGEENHQGGVDGGEKLARWS